MSKIDRSYATNTRVYSFIPTHQLPKGAPHKYDAFFQPLIEEMEDLFINGEEVYFAGDHEVDGGSPCDEFPTLRLLPLMITADSKAHCEIGLTGAGGYRGCRRCNLGGTYVRDRRHYYHGDFWHRYRYPVELRQPTTNRQFGRSVDNATTAAEKNIKGYWCDRGMYLLSLI